MIDLCQVGAYRKGNGMIYNTLFENDSVSKMVIDLRMEQILI